MFFQEHSTHPDGSSVPYNTFQYPRNNAAQVWHPAVQSPVFVSPFLNNSHPDYNVDAINKDTEFTAQGTLQDDLTIVTMYIDIGKFQKGAGGSMFTPDLYKKWMQVFAYIKNPVVALFDKREHASLFQQLRGRYANSTSIIVMEDRNDFWAFSLLHKIKMIFNSVGYPHNPPNTVVPEYSCAMHAKYEFMLWAVQQNIFNTRYFAWLDVGLFRSLVPRLTSTVPFSLYPPPDFDPERVAYSQVAMRNSRATIKEVVFQNMHWVCGCFFLGTPPVLAQWSWQYRATTERMLEENYMSTDQQVRRDHGIETGCG